MAINALWLGFSTKASDKIAYQGAIQTNLSIQRTAFVEYLRFFIAESWRDAENSEYFAPEQNQINPFKL